MQVFSVDISTPFVDVLAGYVLERYGHDPEQLGRLHVLLPSRRACRSFQEALLRASAGRALLLPRLRALGDADEDELMLYSMLNEHSANNVADKIMPSVSSTRRLLWLGRLVWKFNEHRLQHRTTMEQSVRLAGELAAFIDEVAREEADYGALKGLVTEEYAEHWQQVVTFLTIISEQWPRELAQQGLCDAVERRSKMIRHLAQSWEQTPPSFPVIAAGTTGSVPATAELLRVVAGLPEGMLVLPGLDLTMTDEAWDAVEDTHPMASMKLLLNKLGVSVREIKNLTSAPQPLNAALAERVKLMNIALAPASQTQHWRATKLQMQEALAGVMQVNAQSQYEEAGVIALLLRDVLETPGKTGALVTHDRSLARLVSAMMERYGITMDDSAGMPLSQRPAAHFLRLVVNVACERFSPVALLAMLKHPLCHMGMTRAQSLEATRWLEREVLRGARLKPGLEAISSALAKKPVIPDNVRQLVGMLNAVLNPFSRLLSPDAIMSEIPLSAVIEQHIQVAEKLSEDAENCLLWQGQDGLQVQRFMSQLRDESDEGSSVDPGSYAGLLAAIIDREHYYPSYGGHPRLHILSPMEARLQQFDRVILGGLNEGVWPAETTQDPWMSRDMRKAFGLPSPERRIGQAAHDFLSLAGAPELVLTRAGKIGGTPTIASRWLLKLAAVISAQGFSEELLLAPAERWKQWSALMQQPESIQAMQPPAPCPDVQHRPRSLYVTEAEKLLRDPYAIYAAHILKLRKLKPLDEEPEAKDFGTMVHKIFELFCTHYPSDLDADAHKVLLSYGEQVFAEVIDRPSIYTFWWPQFEKIAAWYMEMEHQRRQVGIKVLAEVKGELCLPLPGGDFFLKARMDRVEVGSNHRAVIDYKTGSKKRAADIINGYESQLLMEALILAKGNTAGVAENKMPSQVEYWFLKQTGEDRVLALHDLKDNRKPVDFAELLENTESGLIKLLSLFDNSSQPYLATPDPDRANRFNDYALLERSEEWSVD